MGYHTYGNYGFNVKWTKDKSRRVGRRVDKWFFLNNEYEIILRFNLVIRGIQYHNFGPTSRSVLKDFGM